MDSEHNRGRSRHVTKTDAGWPPGRIVVVMGVSGSGKSTLAEGLAARIGAVYLDGDDLHPQQNVAAMSAGRPLDDAMRLPWLAAVAAAANEVRNRRPGEGIAVVVACSALKRSYREVLEGAMGVFWLIHLAGSKELIASRMAARRGHFMPTRLLESQFADLEAPVPGERTLVLSVEDEPGALVEQAREWLLGKGALAEEGA